MALACFGHRLRQSSESPEVNGKVRRNSLHRVIGVYDADEVALDYGLDLGASGSVSQGCVSSTNMSVHLPWGPTELVHSSDKAVRQFGQAKRSTPTTTRDAFELRSQPGIGSSVPIGEGAFSTVYLVRNHSGPQGAVKAIPVRTAEDAAFAARELRLGHLLASRPACRFPAILDSELCSTPGPDAHAYITFELLAGGTLEQLLERKRSLSEVHTKAVAFALFSALAAIHKEKVVHSDIKPANLMFADVDDLTSLRVVDLGMAAYLQSTRSRAYEVGGTMVYFSPEQVRTWYTKQPGFGFATDIWSAGVVVFEMLSGKQPFTASKVDKTLHRICLMEPRFVGGAVSDNAKDFIRRALAKDPSKRLTAKAALNHPWFAEYKTTNGKPKWLRKLVST